MLRLTVAFYLFVATSPVNCVTVNFNGTIAGGRTILECVNGFKEKRRSRDPKMYTTTSQFARQSGYPSEEHAVLTDDGYILTVHRIPGKPGATPVFLQHGLVASSYDWVASGKEKALAFKLADAGYDVWMRNARGNTYSRCHTERKTSDFKFWDFSWHEIGIYDLPAMIMYVANTTGQQIIYIGHSMGTTAFFVMAIERPDIASKVKLMVALAPIAFMGKTTSPLRLVAPYAKQIEFLVNLFGKAEMLSQKYIVKKLLKYGCTLSTLQKRVCARLLFFTTGFNSRQFNYTLLADIMYHNPAGSSIKVLNHYFQETNSGRFQYYDHGTEKNLQLYNSSEPPNYNISKITVPVGLIWSLSDVFTYPTDVAQLFVQLPNVTLNYLVPHIDFQHNDFLYAIDAPKLVYEKFMSFISDYR